MVFWDNPNGGSVGDGNIFNKIKHIILNILKIKAILDPMQIVHIVMDLMVFFKLETNFILIFLLVFNIINIIGINI